MDEDLETLLEGLLAAHPGGLAEHRLLRLLQEARPGLFPADLFRDNLGLFRAHFLLFHALYRLGDRLVDMRCGRLEVSALCIRLHPWAEAGAQALGDPDPMRAYYLDLAHLEGTDAADLELMLGAFWSRYLAREDRAAALAVLGLADPVDAATVTRRYRRLAMALHPDWGGEAARFAELQRAMEVLRRGG